MTFTVVLMVVVEVEFRVVVLKEVVREVVFKVVLVVAFKVVVVVEFDIAPTEFEVSFSPEAMALALFGAFDGKADKLTPRLALGMSLAAPKCNVPDTPMVWVNSIADMGSRNINAKASINLWSD